MTICVDETSELIDLLHYTIDVFKKIHLIVQMSSQELARCFMIQFS